MAGVVGLLAGGITVEDLGRLVAERGSTFAARALSVFCLITRVVGRLACRIRIGVECYERLYVAGISARDRGL